jgi:superfamily II DNA or RNA helicase
MPRLRVSPETSLRGRFPEIAAQWHPTKNDGLAPEQISPGARVKAWWKCNNGPDHEWQAVVSDRTGKTTECPFCTRRYASVTNSLAALRPDLAAEWHPTKNAPLTPADVVEGSGRKVWWMCSKGPDHEWEARIAARAFGTESGCLCCRGYKASVTNCIATVSLKAVGLWHPTKNLPETPHTVVAGSEKKKFWWRCPQGHEWQTTPKSVAIAGTGCRYCLGQALDPKGSNSLLALFPDMATEWHPTKNELGADEVLAGGRTKRWWRCLTDPAHEWEASINSRVSNESGCPICSGQKTVPATSLAAKFPELAKQWHPTKNGGVTPDMVPPGTSKPYWWKCENGPDHEWQAAPNNRTSHGAGCPMCSGHRVSVTNSLASLYPEIAAELHPTKNRLVDPAAIYSGSTERLWWRCVEGHEWETRVRARTSGRGCWFCAGNRVPPEKSLAARMPDLAAQWHPTKNGDLRADQVGIHSEQSAWWKCSNGPDHEWQTVVASRAQGSACPFCDGRRASVTNSLAARDPPIAAEWHPTRNGDLTAADLPSGSNRRVWWRCTKQPNHEWSATVVSRTRSGTGCPACNRGWTLSVIREFVRSLAPHLASFTPGELWAIFQQSGALDASGRGRAFIKALATGRFPQSELERFLEGQASAVDDFFADEEIERKGNEPDPDAADAVVPESVEVEPEVESLPNLTGSGILGALGAATAHASDPEAIEFLIASAKAKLWRKALRDDASEATAISEARAFVGSGYADTVRVEFLREYEAARSLPIPAGYSFVPPGGSVVTEPNLMQRLVASRIQRERRMGNWSGTGTGKTNSATLASRVVGAKLTVVCCPNSVVEGWSKAIVSMFPDSKVVCKTFEPSWEGATDHLYLVLNYEMFQQPGSEARVRAFIEGHRLDVVVIDEIQFVKQRSEDLSRRREIVGAMLTLASDENPDLYVLGMSATPAINNLREPIALVEMITGKIHDELETRPTVANCMRVYQRLTTIGPRWMMEHATGCERREVEADCSEFLDEIRRLERRGTPLQLEEILTQARLPTILDAIVPKTIVYTHYIGGADRIVRQLYDAITSRGWRAGFFTGEEKSGLAAFLEGDTDVLIASSAVSTGVDRLQHVCNRLVINVLPWTAAEFEQLIGRIHRQGQTKPVEVVIPITKADVNGEEWSWCRMKVQRLHFKKSVADAAVDGVVPEGHLRSPETAYQDLMGWLNRLTGGQVVDLERPSLGFALPDTTEPIEARRARFGNFSRLNARWNHADSGTTHARLLKEPSEWQHYHDELARVRSGWTVDPQEEFVRWAQRRSDLVIGDFGCGRAKVRAALGDRHVVHSFDHIAFTPEVVGCDMAHVPLDDETLDEAVFCLSMMGSNLTDYVREAYRTLKLDGRLHIYEPTERFSDRDAFLRSLKDLGFSNVDARDLGKFTYVSAIKDHRPRPDAELRGLG